MSLIILSDHAPEWVIEDEVYTALDTNSLKRLTFTGEHLLSVLRVEDGCSKFHNICGTCICGSKSYMICAETLGSYLRFTSTGKGKYISYAVDETSLRLRFGLPFDLSELQISFQSGYELAVTMTETLVTGVYCFCFNTLPVMFFTSDKNNVTGTQPKLELLYVSTDNDSDGVLECCLRFGFSACDGSLGNVRSKIVLRFSLRTNELLGATIDDACAEDTGFSYRSAKDDLINKYLMK